MEKLVYVLRTPADGDAAGLRTHLVGDVTDAIRKCGGAQVSVNVYDEHVVQGAERAIRKLDPPMNACVSFWMQNADDRGPAEEAISAAAEHAHGYLVVESRPLVHAPPVGERAPGANLVTCITRKPGLDDESFFDLWNNEHRKVACETQATSAYVRNAVARPLTPNAPGFDGIVEETFPIAALTDLQVWYACDSQAELDARLRRMVESVTAFLDLSVIESVPMSEYYLG
jgi:hypothetical protein